MNRLLFPAALGCLAAPAAMADTTLHVLHINDLHSRFEQISGSDGPCSAEAAAEGKCVAGIARLATKIAEVRGALQAEGAKVILLDAGDQYQGSLIFTMDGGAVNAEFVTALGIDAMALGNHEFDGGPDALLPFLDGVTVPVVSGNIDVSASVLVGRIADHAVLEVGGKKIGIVSALTIDTAEIALPGPTVTFADEIESLTADVAALEAEGVTQIIALTHVGVAKDMAIAAAVPGIDAVVGGHSHTYLSATDPDRQGPYPTWVDTAAGGMVPVVQAGSYGKYLGHLVLTFDDAGTLIFASGNTIPIDASVVPDAKIAARVAELAAPLEELRARVVGEAATEIVGTRELCRAQECPMGNLVAEAMLDRARPLGAQIALQNGGGLRASIDAGPVTMGDVLTVLPFQNTLSTFDATGADVLAALENGVSQVADGAGRFAQVAGLKYSFDPAAPVGSRVSDVMVAGADGSFAPLDPAASYGMVSNNYIRTGGDGYAMFVDAANAYDYGPDLADVVVDYIGRLSPVSGKTDGRIAVK
jgi:5'-nucleotidase